MANWAQKGDLTDKNGILMSAVITPASTHDIKAVSDVIYNAVVKKPQRQRQQPASKIPATKTKTMIQHVRLDRAYNPKAVKQGIIKRGHVPHIPYKRRRGEGKKDKDKAFQKRASSKKAMGSGENKSMTQQVQEAVHKV